MIKKLILISILCSLMLSCGKKGPPKYETTKMIPLYLKFNEIY